MDFDMKAMVIKSHFTETSSWAVMASKFFNKCVYGSVTLNWDVGGINPYAVRAALGPTHSSGTLLKIVWMPTLHSASMIDVMRKAGRKEDIPREWAEDARGGIPLRAIKPIRLEDYTAEIEVILDMIKENDLILATGHIAPPEISNLMDMAESHRVERIIITHPIGKPIIDLSDKQIMEFAERGGYIEFTVETSLRDNQSLLRTVNLIESVGAENCVLSSDLGRPNQLIPPLGLLKLAKEIIRAGVTKSDVFKMMKVNPLNLLGID
jgi:hypothetical protein